MRNQRKQKGVAYQMWKKGREQYKGPRRISQSSFSGGKDDEEIRCDYERSQMG